MKWDIPGTLISSDILTEADRQGDRRSVGLKELV